MPKGADFVAFWTAGALLADGEPQAVYSPRGIQDGQREFYPGRWRYRGLYPPPIYQVMQAASPLGYLRGAQVYLLLGAALIGLGAWLLVVALGLGPPARGLAVLAAATGPFAVMALLTGQNAGIWLTLLGGGILLMRRGRGLAAGLVLGLLCAKPQFGAVVAAWLVLTGQGRALLGFVLGGAALVAVSVAWGGTEPWIAWLDFATGDHLTTFAPLPYRSISLPALVTLPLRGWPGAVPLSRALSGLGLVSALVLARGAFQLVPADARWPLRAGLVLSALLLSLPHMMEYDLGMHGLLLLAALPLARGRVGWLLAAVLLSPLLTEVAHHTHVPLAPLLLAALVVVCGRGADPGTAEAGLTEPGEAER